MSQAKEPKVFFFFGTLRPCIGRMVDGRLVLSEKSTTSKIVRQRDLTKQKALGCSSA
jgi:hypothetical protein